MPARVTIKVRFFMTSMRGRRFRVGKKFRMAHANFSRETRQTDGFELTPILYFAAGLA